MYAMPVANYMPHLQNSYSQNKERYVIMAAAEHDLASRYYTNYLIASKLQKSIEMANERLYKEKGFRLNSGHTSCLQCFDAIMDKTNVVFSFYDYRIKAKFTLNKKKFIFDFYVYKNDTVLIGKMENKKYSLEEIPYSCIGNYLANI